MQVETFKIGKPDTTLASVYEQQKKEHSTRKLEVNFLRPDFFILSGMQRLKKFHVRAEFKDGEVRGMTLLYDQATETIMDPVAVVMSSAFTPFPGVTGAVAQIGPPPKRKVEYGTGIIVSAAGHILTDRQVTDGCNVIVVSGYGDAERQAEDQASELALIRVYGVPDLVPAAFTGDAGKSPDLTLVGLADPQAQGGGSTVSTVAAKLKGERSSLRRSSASPAPARSTGRAASPAWSSSRRRSLPRSTPPMRSRRRRWCRRRRSASSSTARRLRPPPVARASKPPWPRWCG